jgi:PAS domain S-box-containing protein
VDKDAALLHAVPFHSLLPESQHNAFSAAFEGIGNGIGSTAIRLKFARRPGDDGHHTAVISRNNGRATILFDKPDMLPAAITANENSMAMEILDADPCLIYVRDGKGRIRYCNRAFAGFLGVSRDTVLRAAPYVYPGGQNQVAAYKALERRVAESGEEVHIEEELTASDGSIRHFRTTKKAIRQVDGNTHVLSVSTDIDRLNDEARESLGAYKAREDFFAALSHELRTPLNAVVGMADILLKRNPRKDQKKLMQTLNFSAKSLLGLINNILDFSRIGAGKVELEHINFNLIELLENLHLSLRSWAVGKGLDFSLSVASDVPEIVRGDSMKISQVLNNLVSNAIKFTESGSVRIAVERASVHADGTAVEIAVIDTGIGMTEAQQAVVFDPYRQAESGTARKFGGTGLGLSIVKDLVDMMDGSLKLRSAPGEGTEVHVVLPLEEPDQQPVQSVALPEVGNAKWQVKLQVLYVEDVSTNQVLIEEMLGDWGIEVDMASRGEEALEQIGQKVYDLVLMDIQMPGMDGFETAQKIRAGGGDYRRDVPIVAMTADASASTRRRIFGSGMQDIIQKPINTEELRAKIIEYANIEENIVPGPGAEEDTRDDQWVNFQKTDKLFMNNRLRYQEFLRMAIEELTINKDLLRAAIREEDLAAFRSIHHRMKNLLVTLAMDELGGRLEQIKERMTAGTAGARENGALQRALTTRIDRSLDKIGNKLASLKWQ